MFKKVRKYMMIAVMGITVIVNTIMVYAEESFRETMAMAEAEQAITAADASRYLGEVPQNDLRFYDIPVKNAGKIKVTITGVKEKNKVTIFLESDKKISNFIKMESGNPSIVFYVEKADIYTLSILNYSGNTVKVKYTFTKKENQGGNSFSKAVALKKA